MHCLKCGRELENEQVFCNDCLQQMAQYPVKPGTPVNLPIRSGAEEPRKKSRRRVLSAEEQVVHLRQALRRMTTCAALLLAALGIVTAMFLYELFKPDPEESSDWGHDYSSSEQSEP